MKLFAIYWINLLLYLLTFTLEAERQEHINKASGEAAAMIAVADARARSLQAIAKSLAHTVRAYKISKSSNLI